MRREPKFPAHIQKIKRRNAPGHRYYLRAGPGRKRTTLTGEYGSPEFIACWLSGFVVNGAAATPTRALKDTVAWAIDVYLDHFDFKRRPASVREKHERHLGRFRKAHGSRMLRDTPTDKLKKVFAGVADEYGINSANQFLDGVRDLYAFAHQQGMIATNPAARDLIEKLDREGDGHVCWEHEWVAAYRDRWPEGTVERLILEMVLTLALRRSDLIRVGPSQVNKAGKLVYKQHKGRERKMKGGGGAKGVLLKVPVPAELWRYIDAERATQKVVCLGGKRPDRFVLFNGRAWDRTDNAEKEFSKWFKIRCQQAGLPDAAVLHGLRKRSCADMIDAGRTPDEVRAISGHQTYEQLLVYIYGRNQERLAERALAVAA